MNRQEIREVVTKQFINDLVNECIRSWKFNKVEKRGITFNLYSSWFFTKVEVNLYGGIDIYSPAVRRLDRHRSSQKSFYKENKIRRIMGDIKMNK